MNGWVGVDLDRTLAFYDKWRGPTHIGYPLTPMVKKVQTLLFCDGIEVRVFTARMSTPNRRERAAIQAAIHVWTRQHVGIALEATCVKDFHMWELWDDRAVQVEPNTGEALHNLTAQLKTDNERYLRVFEACPTCNITEDHLHKEDVPGSP
jgi:hypothetical protein